MRWTFTLVSFAVLVLLVSSIGPPVGGPAGSSPTVVSRLSGSPPAPTLAPSKAVSASGPYRRMLESAPLDAALADFSNLSRTAEEAQIRPPASLPPAPIDPNGSVLTFDQTGMPLGGYWAVQLYLGAVGQDPYGAGTSFGGPSISFSVPNHNYTYLILGEGYVASPQAGSAVVNGTPVVITTVFSPTPTSYLTVQSSVNFGDQTTIHFAAKGKNVDSFSYSGVVEVLSYVWVPGDPYPELSLCGSGNITGSTYSFSCPNVADFVWLVFASGCYVGIAECGGLPGPFAVATGLFANPALDAFEISQGLYFAGTAINSVSVHFGTGVPNVLVSASGSILGGTASTGSLCPCELRVAGFEYDRFSSFSEGFPGTTGAYLTLPPGSYEYGFSDAGGTPLCSEQLVSTFGCYLTEGTFTIQAKSAKYLVSIPETGLPAGTNWSVTINGATKSTTGNRLNFSEPDGLYAARIGSTDPQVVPQSGSIEVFGRNQTLPARFSELTFQQNATTQLPAGQSWGVTVGGTPASAPTRASNITMYALNGTYPYRVAPEPGYGADLSGNGVVPSAVGVGNLTVRGVNAVVNVSFRARVYGVVFAETGLPSFSIGNYTQTSLRWTVNVTNTSSGAVQSETAPYPSFVFAEPNGSYSFTVAAPRGYAASPASGTLGVLGGNVSQSIHLRPTVNSTIRFVEAGLPGGTPWSVVLNGSHHYSSTANLSVALTNGTYPYTISTNLSGYPATPSSGNLTIQGANETVYVVFGAAYQVTFDEGGLPGGTNWSVTLGRESLTTSNASLSFLEPAGTYPFSIAPVSGFARTPASGNVSVTTANVSETIDFANATIFPLSFNESGLPAGASWNVSIAGVGNQTSSGTRALYVLGNGTYSYTLSAPGYAATPASGTITVAGGSPSVPVSFAQSGPPIYFPLELRVVNLPNGTAWTAEVNGSYVLSTTNSTVVDLPDGTYNYTATAPIGYRVSPSSGALTLNGSGETANLTMSPGPGGAAVGALYGLYAQRPDLQSAFPFASQSPLEFDELLNWAAGVAEGSTVDGSANVTGSVAYGYYYVLLTVYNSRPDLQAAFPNATSNATSYAGLLTWAAGVSTGANRDSASATLAPWGSVYDLLGVYEGRPDLESAFPNAVGNLTELAALTDWAGSVVTGSNGGDSAYATLAPYGYFYDLLGSVYGARPDLRAAFPSAYTNEDSFRSLVAWAGGVVDGANAGDSAYSTLQGYGYWYDLMGSVYTPRPDLQAAFPNAFSNSTSYDALLAWAGAVVTGQILDGANATLQPYGYYYDLMGIYLHRADLQAAFPTALANEAAYASLLGWAKDVVEKVFPDSDYVLLEPYAAYYIAHG